MPTGNGLCTPCGSLVCSFHLSRAEILTSLICPTMCLACSYCAINHHSTNIGTRGARRLSHIHSRGFRNTNAHCAMASECRWRNRLFPNPRSHLAFVHGDVGDAVKSQLAVSSSAQQLCELNHIECRHVGGQWRNVPILSCSWISSSCICTKEQQCHCSSHGDQQWQQHHSHCRAECTFAWIMDLALWISSCTRCRCKLEPHHRLHHSFDAEHATME